MSTSHRYGLMSNDMDVDAGAPGTRAELGLALLDLTLKVALTLTLAPPYSQGD